MIAGKVQSWACARERGVRMNVRALVLASALALPVAACSPSGGFAARQAQAGADAPDPGYRAAPSLSAVAKGADGAVSLSGRALPSSQLKMVSLTGVDAGPIRADGSGVWTAQVGPVSEPALYTLTEEVGSQKVEAEGLVAILPGAPTVALLRAGFGAEVVRDGGKEPLKILAVDYDVAGSAVVSGAARASHDLKGPVLNVDIGGGTTKLALVENGRVVHTAAIHIGGRLMAHENGVITRLDPAGRQLAKNAGVEWSVGAEVTDADIERVAAWMADALVAALTEDPPPAQVAALWLTDPLEPVEGISGVMFSGGVAEYVYGREERDFGDLGRRLGAALRKRVDAGGLPYPQLPAGECIRATAIGASEYSVQLSGNTVYISNPGELLPRKNLQVLQPDVDLAGTIDPARVTQAIRRHFEAFDLREGESDVALAFRWDGPPAYSRLAALAQGIVEALPMTLMESKPVFLVLDGDIAHSLGALLKDEWNVASDVLVIDGVSLWDFDYIDLGRVRMPSHTVPVTIKSLVFSEDPRGPKMRGHGHSHGHDHAHGHGHHHHGHGHK